MGQLCPETGSRRQTFLVSGHLLGVALVSLAAACCCAASSVTGQRKASQAPPETEMKLGLLWHLARQPVLEPAPTD